MDKVVRTGISLEPELLAEFDDLVRERGCDTRSEAVRDMIRRLIIQESLINSDAHCVGTIAFVVDRHSGTTSDHLTEIQHRFADIITSATHVHLDHDRCLEVLVVHGKQAIVRALYQGLASTEGVTITAPVLMAGDVVDHVHD